MKVIRRDELGAECWNAFVDAAPEGWFWQRAEWLDYLAAFAPGNADRSFAVVQDDSVIAICPLTWDAPSVSFTNQGAPGPCPIICATGEARIDALNLINAELTIQRLQSAASHIAFRSMPLAELNTILEELTIFEGWRDVSWQTRVINLGLPKARLWRAVRKSYKALIHRAESRYRIDVDEIGDLLGDYIEVHRASGAFRYLPRRLQTYDLQRQWMRDGHAFLIGARPRGGSASWGNPGGAGDGSAPSASTTPYVACVYVITYRGGAYYASAPSLAPSVVHALQWRAILEAKRRGCIRYETGWQHHDYDPKRWAVEFFTRGFGGIDERVCSLTTSWRVAQ